MSESPKRKALRRSVVNALLVRDGWRDGGAWEFVAMMREIERDPSPTAKSLFEKLVDLTPSEWNLLIAKIPPRKRGRPRSVSRHDLGLAAEMIRPVILDGRPVSKVATEFASRASGNSHASTALRLERTFRELTGWKRPKKK